MCADCQAARGRGSGPYPVMTRAEMRAGLDLLPTWVLEQKAAANRQLIAAMRLRLAAGEQVARMHQEPELAAARARGHHGGRPSVMTAHKLQVAEEMYGSGQYSVAAIAKTLGVSRASIYRHLTRAGG